MQHLIEQKMLDELLPTWAAKQVNNVGSSKVAVLNPTLFDSLAMALESDECLLTWENANFEICLLPYDDRYAYNKATKVKGEKNTHAARAVRVQS